MRGRGVVRLLLPLLAIVSACAGGDEGRDSAGTSAAATRSRVQTPATGSADTATLTTPRGPVLVRGDSAPGATEVLAEPLQWTGDDVMQRLQEAQLAPVSRGGVQGGPISAPGLRVSVMGGAAEVQAFVFGDAGAVGLATRGLDLRRFASGDRTASLLVDNNLAAVIITADESLRERIRVALDAHRGEGR